MPQSDRDKAMHASMSERGFKGALSHGPSNTKVKRSILSRFQRKTREESEEEESIKKSNQATLDKRKKRELATIASEEKGIQARQEIIKAIQSGKASLEDLEALDKAPVESGILPKHQEQEIKKRQIELNKKLFETVKGKIETNNKKADDLNERIRNPNKAISESEADNEFEQIIKEKKLLDAELSQVSNVLQQGVGTFGTAIPTDKGSLERIRDPDALKRLREAKRDFERFRNPSKLFPSGSQKKRRSGRFETVPIFKDGQQVGFRQREILSSELTPTEFKKQQEIKKEGLEEPEVSAEVSAEKKEENKEEKSEEEKPEFNLRLSPNLASES